MKRNKPKFKTFIKVRRNENITVTMAGGFKCKRTTTLDGIRNPFVSIQEVKNEEDNQSPDNREYKTN